MRNCIVAQSGGPTAVINASVVGVVEESIKSGYYDNVYGGLNGIEGILKGEIINLSEYDHADLQILKYTPSSGLGSCRYKLSDFKSNDTDYKKLLDILNKLSVKTFFYIGGNDSMDTVYKLSEYAKLHSIDIQFIGIPKTIDNDLVGTDHTPGYGSAAKFVATTVLESYFDATVYPYNGVFIMEVMGRNAGWLAASAALAKINGKPVADFIYLPEIPFSVDKFLEDVKAAHERKNCVYVVVSEGISDENGKCIAEMGSKNVEVDKFGHAKLGGVCGYLKHIIEKNKVASKVRTLELGITQRSAMHNASQRDIDEAYSAGIHAVRLSIEGKTGYMVSISRLKNKPYESEMGIIKASEVANAVKYFPVEWISEGGNHVKDEALEYIHPLIMGSPNVALENGLPKYADIRNGYKTVINE